MSVRSTKPSRGKSARRRAGASINGKRTAARTQKVARQNPPLVIFGNPRRGGVLGDVKAIVYRHAETRELMVHGFGPRGESIRLEDLHDGVAIRRLPFTTTGARAFANADGSITIRNTSGKPLWADL